MRIFVIAVALIAGATSALAQNLRIVTTTQDLAAIASAVGGNRATVTPLVTGARDPHRLEARPSFMSLVGRADMFIAVGLELEAGYEQAILEGARNARVRVGQPGHAYAASWVTVLEKPDGPVTRAQGDVHPGGNPHIWLDPYNGRIIALRLAERMGRQSPANAATYKANADKFVADLDRAMFGPALVNRFGADRLWQWTLHRQLQTQLRSNNAQNLMGGWIGRMAPFAGSPIVTYHRSWTYFVNRFSLRVVAELEPRPGIDPTPNHLANVARIVQENNVKAILQEPFYSTRNSNFVASRTGAQVVVAPGGVGHDSAATNYITLFDTIVDRLVRALR